MAAIHKLNKIGRKETNMHRQESHGENIVDL
jgi:hypothetical protein